jgi:acetyltransferase-like isoleucine patch superfamily enzyme
MARGAREETVSADTIVHDSIVTPSVELRGACTVLDCVLRGDIVINPRAVLQGVEVSGRGTFYGRVVVVASSDHPSRPIDAVDEGRVTVGPGVTLGTGVRVLGRGTIRGALTIEVRERSSRHTPIGAELMPEMGAWEGE